MWLVGEDDVGEYYRKWRISDKVLIPGLPDESNGKWSIASCESHSVLKDGAASEGKDFHLVGLEIEIEPWANELVFSMDLWLDHVRKFIEEFGRKRNKWTLKVLQRYLKQGFTQIILQILTNVFSQYSLRITQHPAAS
ncbi:hypothetical protein NC653_022912 [Populus alba x Populus x berolinensis]|uniref:Uncharacterized protein n=1 Tax=Populus alba x Populus x berolinensis TaxID=444605 RepID=A0AAD6MGH4_9ROSI|nr:hypothetical protein NC653_022912 [Populus alba x Populus x berolinensis]